MNEAYWIIAAMLPAGLLTTYLWRWLGVVAVARIDPESDILLWVRAVSTALVAALVMRIVVAPSGVLGDISLVSRLGAVAVGVAVFMAFSRATQAATFATVFALALLALTLG